MSSPTGRVVLLSSLAFTSFSCLGGAGLAQTAETLPTVEVVATTNKPAKNQAEAQSTPVQPPSETPEAAAARQLTEKAKTFDKARSNLFTAIGTTSYRISHDDIQSMPQGVNQPVEKVLLQAPGVSRIPRRAACSMSATITPMCNSGSMASCCPMASPALGVFWKPI